MSSVLASRAARSAEGHDGIVCLPRGDGTLTREPEGRLSGGQGQCVALVRPPSRAVRHGAASAIAPQGTGFPPEGHDLPYLGESR